MRQQQLLMSRIELVAVGEATLMKALQRITGCAACSASASHSLDWLIHQVLGNTGMTEYFLSSATECPKCGAPIFERTLVDFDGKAIAALDEYKYFDVCDEEQDVVFIDEPTLLDA